MSDDIDILGADPDEHEASYGALQNWVIRTADSELWGGYDGDIGQLLADDALYAQAWKGPGGEARAAECKPSGSDEAGTGSSKAAPEVCAGAAHGDSDIEVEEDDEEEGQQPNTAQQVEEEQEAQQSNTEQQVEEEEEVAYGLSIDRASVCDAERAACSEFFVGHAAKTPARYMKIRNHILDRWEKQRPAYVTKTAVRAGLRDCGDVNAIGRVHTFLEAVGAINEGCTPPRKPQPQPAYVPPQLPPPHPRKEEPVVVDGPRKRRVRDDTGAWIDERDLEGRTVDHSAVETATAPKREKRAPRKPGYDPFRLVPCDPPTPHVPAFDTVIHTRALVLMDVHAHMTHNEVIGLLGGTYHPHQHRLEVRQAWPCDSKSTGLQCEMEPTSEMAAREAFASQGLEVVGWYHSHPAFAARPSVRDIENQISYQELFKRMDGIKPFIGVIVSPYDPQHPALVSDVALFFASDDHDDLHECRRPVSCAYEHVTSTELEPDLGAEVRRLVDKYANYPQRTQMLDAHGVDGEHTRLQKLAASLESHLHAVAPDTAAAFLAEVADMFMSLWHKDEATIL